MPQECNLVLKNNEITGRVTSVSYSPSLNKIIGLAFVSPDKSEDGSKIDIKLTNTGIITATVCSIPFYDPENKRQDM
jgi:sarcosine oxidase subunit alpha